MKEQKVFFIVKETAPEVAEELRSIIESGWNIVSVTNLNATGILGYKLIAIVERKKRGFWKR